jgi:Tol biopolymer transport system component
VRIWPIRWLRQGTNFINDYGGIAPSPDGRYVIFAARGTGQPSLYVRSLDSLTALQLPGTETGNYPTWSPDSRSVIFYASGKIKRIELSGGARLTLAEVQDSAVSPAAAWNRDGVILLGSGTGQERMSASGGAATLMTKIDPAKKEAGHGYPQFLPDGDRFLSFVDSADPTVRGTYQSSLRNPEQRKQILRTTAKVVYPPPRGAYPGYLLWTQGQTLLAQRFNAESLQLEGEPASVAEEIGFNPSHAARAAFWASESGLLVYNSEGQVARRPIVWYNRDGKSLGEVLPADGYQSISLAPGGQRLAVTLGQKVNGTMNYDVWVRDLARGAMTRITFDPTIDRLPTWSPDGKQTAFSSGRDGDAQIYVKDASGAGMEERLTDGPGIKFVLDWSKDGKYILFRQENVATGRGLMALPLQGDRKPFPVSATQFTESTGAISPDGHWVACSSNDSGRFEIYVQAFPGSGSGVKGRWQISNGPSYDVKWRGDGKELYWEAQDGMRIMGATIEGGPQGMKAGTPRVVVPVEFVVGGVREFDVTPDGQRFLVVAKSLDTQANRLTVLANWPAALRK